MILARSEDDNVIAVVTNLEIIADSGNSEYVGISIWPLSKFARHWRREVRKVKWIF